MGTANKPQQRLGKSLFSYSLLRRMQLACYNHLLAAHRAAEDVSAIEHQQDLGNGHALYRAAQVSFPAETAYMAQVFGFAAVGQVAAEANTMEPSWEYMEHKPPDEFLAGKDHGFLAVLVRIIGKVYGNIAILDLINT